MKTLIAIPCMDTLHTDFARCLVDMTRIAPQDTFVCFKQSSLIYDSRNLLSLTAIEGEFDRILWLDSDMTFPMNTLAILSDDMDKNGYDLVSGLYVKRKSPVQPVLYKHLEIPDMKSKDLTNCFEDYLDYPVNSIFPIEGCGFGCVLVTVDLIKRVFDKFGPAFSPMFCFGEDISFCYRAKQLGAKMYCDSRVSCGHIGPVIFSEEIYLKQRGDFDE